MSVPAAPQPPIGHRPRLSMLGHRCRVILPIALTALIFLTLAAAAGASSARSELERDPIQTQAVGWNPPVPITDGSGNERWPAAAADDSGRVHLVYVAGDAGQVLYRTSADGQQWSAPIEIAEASYGESRPAVAARTGHAAAVVWVGADRALYYRSVSDSMPGRIERVAEPPVHSTPAVAIDTAGQVHVAYRTYLGSSLQVLHRVRTTAGWSAMVELSANAGATESVSLHADSTGSVHATWAEFVADNWEVGYRRYVGSGWQATANVSANSSFSMQPVVASDPQGGARIAWLDETAQGQWSMLLRPQGATSTQTVQIDVHRGVQPGLVVDRTGTSHVLMVNQALTQVVYSAVDVAGVREQLQVNDTAHRVTHPAIVLDTALHLYAFWEQSDGSTSRIMLSRRANALPTPTPTASPTPPPTPIPPSNLDAPLLISPVGDASLTSSSAAFMWTAVAGAARYRLEYDTAADFSSTNKRAEDVLPVRTITGTLQYVASLPRTNAAQRWYWRVTAIDSIGAISRNTSPAERFWIPEFQPPALRAPADGHTFLVPSDPVRFSWAPAEGAEEYLIEITSFPPSALPPQPDGRYQTTVHSARIPKSRTTYATPASSPSEPLFENDRVYYWHVASLDANGNVLRMSESRAFQKSYPAPVVISPADSFDTAYVDVTFEWLPVGGASQYEIEIAPSSDFANLVYYAKSAGTKHTPTRSLPDDEYWLRIRAIDSGGHPGSWSQLQRFKRAWPAAPELLEPAAGAGSTGGAPGCLGPTTATGPGGRPPESIYLRWKPVPKASRYHVKLVSQPDDPTVPPIEVDVQVARTDWSPPRSLAEQLTPQATYYWTVWAIDDTTAPAEGPPRAQSPSQLYGPPSETRCFRLQDVMNRQDPPDVVAIPRQPAGNAVALRQAPDRYDEHGVPVYVGLTPAITWDELAWEAYNCQSCGPEHVDYYAITVGYDESLSNIFNTGLPMGTGIQTNESYRTRATSFTPTDEWPDLDASRGYFVTVSPVFTGGVAIAPDPSIYSYHAFNKVAPPGPTLVQPEPQQVITDVPLFEWRELSKVDPGMNKADGAPLYGYYNPNTAVPQRNAADRAFAAAIDTTGDTYWLPIQYYVLQVAEDPSFERVILTSTTPVTSTPGITDTNGISETHQLATSTVPGIRTDSTSYQPDTWNLPDGVYYWRVCAVPYGGSDGCDDAATPRQSWSEVRSFTYRKPNAVRLDSSDGSESEVTGQLLQWEVLDRAVSYEVQIAEDLDFSRIRSSEMTGKTVYSPPCISAGGTYYWRVRAIFADGSSGGWTTGPSFRTEGASTCERSFTVHLPAAQASG